MISQPADLLCQREVQRFEHPVGLQIGLRPGGRSQIVFPLQILVAVGLGKRHKIADHHRRLLQIILREPVPRHHQLRKPLQIGRIGIGKAHQRHPPDALRALRVLADELLDPSPDLFFQLLRAHASILRSIFFGQRPPFCGPLTLPGMLFTAQSPSSARKGRAYRRAPAPAASPFCPCRRHSR